MCVICFLSHCVSSSWILILVTIFINSNDIVIIVSFIITKSIVVFIFGVIVIIVVFDSSSLSSCASSSSLSLPYTIIVVLLERSGLMLLSLITGCLPSDEIGGSQRFWWYEISCFNWCKLCLWIIYAFLFLCFCYLLLNVYIPQWTP